MSFARNEPAIDRHNPGSAFLCHFCFLLFGTHRKHRHAARRTLVTLWTNGWSKIRIPSSGSFERYIMCLKARKRFSEISTNSVKFVTYTKKLEWYTFRLVCAGVTVYRRSKAKQQASIEDIVGGRLMLVGGFDLRFRCCFFLWWRSSSLKHTKTNKKWECCQALVDERHIMPSELWRRICWHTHTNTHTYTLAYTKHPHWSTRLRLALKWKAIRNMHICAPFLACAKRMQSEEQNQLRQQKE